MKLPMSLKAFALIAAGSFAFAGGAYAYDDDSNAGDAVVGIIGEVLSGAIAAEQAEEAAREQEYRCARWQARCEDGADWACRKYEYRCND